MGIQLVVSAESISGCRCAGATLVSGESGHQFKDVSPYSSDFNQGKRGSDASACPVVFAGRCVNDGVSITQTKAFPTNPTRTIY
jgi:hypothetical protein